LKEGENLIYIFNQNEDLQTILIPDSPVTTTINQEYTQLATMFTGGDETVTKNSACPYKEAAHLEQINGEHTFSFWVPADHPDSQFIKEENLVAFKDEDGDIRLFVIKELDEVHDDTLYKEVFCQAAWIDELNDEPIKDIRPQDKTAAYALGQALQNTRWQAGNVAELGLNGTNFYYENAVSAIKKIINKWGGEIKDRIVITDGKITGRYIDILTRRGADTGKRFEITKEIQSLKRTVLSYPKTALYGRGKGLETESGGYSRKITFADVAWSKENGDPADKPVGQEWVGDPEALVQHGRADGTRHRFGFFDSSDEKDPAKLLKSTWDDLQIKKKPIVQYDLKVIDLENVPGFDHEKVRLGDTNFIIDRLFTPAVLVEARVIEIKRYLNEPERTEIKLGNFIDDILDYNLKLDGIEATINDNKGIWDQGGDPVNDDDIEDIIPAQPANVEAIGGFKKVILEWDFVNAIYIANYEVYGSQIPGFTADLSNLLWRGKNSGFAHDADVNQQWYYRVRAVNTHGNAGPFSQEVTATTARIITDDILFGAVNADILADLAVEAGKLAELAVENTKLGDSAVSATKIMNLAVGNAAIANAAISNAKIGTLAVSTAQIQNLAATNAKIGDLAIDDGKIANLSVITGKIANLAVTNAKIGDAAITTAKINDAAVTNAKIANLAVTNAKIADATITSAKISSLIADKITSGSMSADRISGGTITGAAWQSDSDATPFNIYIGTTTKYLAAAFYVDNLNISSCALTNNGIFQTASNGTPYNFYIGVNKSYNPLTINSGNINTNANVNVVGQITSTGTIDGGVNSTNAYFRYDGNTTSYLRIGNTSAALYVNGASKASWSSMPKTRLEPSGDGVLDGLEFGANNPASMQPILMDYFTGIKVDGERTIILDGKFIQFVSSYDVFISDCDIKLKEKGSDYIILQGTGTCSLFVMGIQRGKENIVGYEFINFIDEEGQEMRDFSEKRIDRI
jgi:phage minor structural protein